MSEIIREFYLPVVQEHFNNRAREADVFFAMMTGFWGTKQMDFYEYYSELNNNPWERRTIEKTRKAIRREW